MPVTIRPIRPEDEPLIVEFHKHLSEQSIYFRYFRVMEFDQRTAHERLTRICYIDYDRELAIVAERRNTPDGIPQILGVGRLIKSSNRAEGEFAVLVADHVQRQGLGTKLLECIVRIARCEKLSKVTGSILAENMGMLKVSERLGFHLKPAVDGITEAEINLL